MSLEEQWSGPPRSIERVLGDAVLGLIRYALQLQAALRSMPCVCKAGVQCARCRELRI